MDPRVGRFVSVDPFDGDQNIPVSLHRYLYANQSPISMSDPTGKMTLVEVSIAITISGILSTILIENIFDVKVTTITMKRINPHKDAHGNKDYGHWWTELIGGESYGWWPDRQVGLLETVGGVPGDLNGQNAFGGTSTRDPYHGQTAEITPWGKVKSVPDTISILSVIFLFFLARNQ